MARVVRAIPESEGELWSREVDRRQVASAIYDSEHHQCVFRHCVEDEIFFVDETTCSGVKFLRIEPTRFRPIGPT